MRSNPLVAILVFSAITLVIDFYVWWGITKIISGVRSNVKKIIVLLYWIVPVLILVGFATVLTFRDNIPPDRTLSYFHLISGSFFIFYIPKLIFIIFNFFDDVIFQIRKIITTTKQKMQGSDNPGKKITRRKLLTQVGIVFAGLPLLPLVYGIAHGRFDFTKRNVQLTFPNLPDSSGGLKIIQISDFHIGTFIHHTDEVEKLVELINEENPDLLLFTGDFINNYSAEVDSFIDILKNFSAKIGKFSILGNHDYGEYVPWKTEADKKANVQRLMDLQKEIGFDLLMDESRKIQIGDDKIELIGIQNWGMPPFPQYGDLNKAMKNVKKDAFKILMSHDPTHWDAQVREKTDIDLMLSGHTHGAQFGIDIPGWRWSPVTMRYKQWGGLYTQGKQSLYVNTGLGSIGYPGRVGMPPEITVIELYNG
jgi:predicted MPP superfamily phosphohydrolase